jgi:hypothetical protein
MLLRKTIFGVTDPVIQKYLFVSFLGDNNMFRKIEKPTLLRSVLNIPEERYTILGDPLIPFSLMIPFLLGACAILEIYNDKRSVALMKFTRLGCENNNSENCSQIASDLERHDGVYWMAMMLFCISILLGVRGAYVARKNYVNYRHPHQKIAEEFLKANPTYPSNREKQTGYCPISRGATDTPVCISYKYLSKPCSNIYDYPTLIKWFTHDQGFSDPMTNINLKDDKGVSEFNITFDIPQELLDKSQANKKDNDEGKQNSPFNKKNA